MARRSVLAGLSATLALVVASSSALAGDLFLVQVSKQKDGVYSSGVDLNVPPGAKRRAYFKMSNNTASPVDATFTQGETTGDPEIKLRWYRGKHDITKAVKGDGYVRTIAGNSALIVTLRVTATGPGDKCTSGRGETESALSGDGAVTINGTC